MEQDYLVKLELQNLLDKELMYSSIYPNNDIHLYWSDDWSKEFYIESAYAGFISTGYKIDDVEILIPEMQKDYAVLDWKQLKISKNVRNTIFSEAFLNNEFYVRFNGSIEEVIKKITTYHKESWIVSKYSDLIKRLIISNSEKNNFNIISVEICDSQNNEIIAGEIGYIIGATYTSLTGFCEKKNKKYNNFGTLQLVLLAKTLEYYNFDFWNLGHPNMEYKKSLGAEILSRSDFLKRWVVSRDKNVETEIKAKKQFNNGFYKKLIDGS